MESVFREVQTGYLNKRDKVSPIKGLNTDIQSVQNNYKIKIN
jgi:hypothetical protein